MATQIRRDPGKSWWRERLAGEALEYPIPARANRLDFILGALTLAGASCTYTRPGGAANRQAWSAARDDSTTWRTVPISL